MMVLHYVQAIEEGVCHMWTVSAFQQHPNTMIIVDEVARFSEQRQCNSFLASYLGLIVFQHRWCTSGRNPWAASADSEILQGHVAGWKFSRRTSVQKAFQGQKQSFFLNRCTLIWTSWATMRWGSWVSDPKLTKLNFSKLQRERQFRWRKSK